MNLRDYKVIIKVLREAKQKAQDAGIFSAETVENIISAFCSALTEQNPSFNEQKFREEILK